MIFYDFDLFAPSPYVVRMFAEEKGLKLERKVIDLLTRENRRAPFTTAISPLGELPAMLLDDGTALTEITAICEYLEEMHPKPSLIGSTPLERAETRMWVRRIEQKIAEPMGEGFSAAEGREFFESDHKDPDLITKTVLPPEAGRRSRPGLGKRSSGWTANSMGGSLFAGTGSRWRISISIAIYSSANIRASRSRKKHLGCAISSTA